VLSSNVDFICISKNIYTASILHWLLTNHCFANSFQMKLGTEVSHLHSIKIACFVTNHRF